MFDDLLRHDDDINEQFERFSEDKETNYYGQFLFELCFNYSLFIINGIGNCKDSGKFTFISPNGNSVIDFFLVSNDLINNSIKMNVLSDITSWHMPITLCIEFDFSCNTNDDDEQTNTAMNIIKWGDEKADTYYDKLNSLIQTLPHVTDTNALNINSYVHKLTNIIISASDCMIVPLYTKTKMFKTKNKWFDKECF